MARGVALVEDVLPVLDRYVSADLDAYATGRLAEMRDRYSDYIARVRRAA
jgi:hypothetical protein